MTIHIRTHAVIFLREGIDGGPGGAVIEACAEVAVGHSEGSVLFFLAGETPAVPGQGRQAVRVTGAEGIVVVLLGNRPACVHDGPHTPQVVCDVVVHVITGPVLADTSPTEGHALEGCVIVRIMRVGKGPQVVIAHPRGVQRPGLRPIGQVCVTGLHDASRINLCRQVNQIVRHLQGMSPIRGHIAVGIVGVGISCSQEGNTIKKKKATNSQLLDAF